MSRAMSLSKQNPIKLHLDVYAGLEPATWELQLTQVAGSADE